MEEQAAVERERLTPTIVDAMAAREFFGPAFPERSSWVAWVVFLKALYGLDMSAEEQKLFTDCTERPMADPSGYREAYAVVGRRGGKSRIASLIVAYEALFNDWSPFLASGEKAWLFVVATEKSQARVALGYIKGLLQLFPDVVERETQDELWLRNNTVIAVKTASYRASRGYSIAGVVLDELAFFRDENSANPADEIITSLLPGMLKGALLLGISTPYARSGYLFETLREHHGAAHSDLLTWRAPTRVMNPAYDEAILRRMERRDPVGFRAEYLAEFRADIESYLSLEQITAAMTRPSATPPASGLRYEAFIDPSGGRSDSFTMAIGHREGEKAVIDYMDEREPPFNPADVVAQFAAVMKSYSVSVVRSDRYAGVWPSAAFLKHGIRVADSPYDKSDLYLNFAPALMMGKVELIKSDRLRLQLQSLERRTRSGGKDQIDHPGALHDDLANAIAGCAVYLLHGNMRTLDEMSLPIAAPNSTPRYDDRPRWQEDEEESMRKFLGGSRVVRR